MNPTVGSNRCWHWTIRETASRGRQGGVTLRMDLDEFAFAIRWPVSMPCTRRLGTRPRRPRVMDQRCPGFLGAPGMKQLLVAVGLVSSLSAQGELNVPRGYRLPTEGDYSGDWKEFRSTRPEPFVVNADFNGDGRPDQVWLLPAIGGGWGLFAFLGSSKGTYRVTRLDRDGKTAAQGFGLGIVEPGRLQTACGKGYWACKQGEPAVLELQLPAIEFFAYESASSVFWWDRRTGQFRRAWLSD